ncbi:MAG: PAS-domain containing protein, partial [Planctomycetota bacterium]|nr:PAS-domain containing protein [Planctomycetota bacterium]
AAAAAIGSIAAVVMYAVATLLERFEIDDVVGAVPVHLAAGIWGTLAVAIFGDPASWGTGLSRWEQFGVQATGVGATFAWAFGVGFALLWLVNRVHPLRIDPEGERIGLNVAEHGASTEILDLLTEMDGQRRAGDFSQPVSVEPHTEIGQIAQQYNHVLADINAEQKQREAVTEALRRQTASLRLLREAASAANRAKSMEDAIRNCLESICAYGGWSIGHCFMVDEAVKKLISTKIWHLDDEERYAAFREVTENTELMSGTGLSSLVLASGEPNWVANLSEDKNFSRAAVAKDIGIKGGAAFPVLVGDDVVAVLEFFSGEAKAPDEAISEVMGAVGTQLGRVVERERSTAARFKSVVDNMPAHVHLRDRGGRFILVNRQYEEFYGVTNDFVRGKTLREINEHAKFDVLVDENEAFDRQVIDTDRIVELEFDVTREGELRTLSDVKFPIKDHSGEIIALGGVEVDITERKKSAEALRQARVHAEEAEVRLLDAVENFSEAFVLYDAEQRLVLCNSRFKDLYHLSDADIRPGTPREELAGLVFERGIIALGDESEEEFTRRRKAYRDDPGGSFEFQTSEGRWYMVRERSTAAGGKVVIQADITERKQAESKLLEGEERLRLALKGGDLGFWDINLETGSIVASEQWAKMLGYSLDEIDDLRDVALATFHPDDFERVSEYNQRINEGEITNYEIEYRVITKQGETRWQLSKGETVQLTERGKPCRMVGTVMDITERKRAEESLAEKEAQLRVALDNMPGGMVVEDRDRNYVLFNSKYGELHDYPEEFLKIGMSAREEVRFQAERGDFGPGNTDELVEQVLELYQEGKATSWERTFPSGRTLQFNVEPTPDGGMVEVTNDITERKRAEQELAEKEAQLRVALDNMPGGMVLYDRDLKYVLFNSKYGELHDYPEEFLKIGMSAREEVRFQAERGDFGP